MKRFLDRTAHGELIVIQHDGTRIALRPLLPSGNDPDVAPPGYFAQDYTANDVAELNHLAFQGPLRIV
jgi:hypothetical protein